MKKVVIALLLLIFGCTTNQPSTVKRTSSQEIVLEWPEETKNLQIPPEKLKKIRPLLNIYYENNDSKWEKARNELRAMGSEGKYALCLFFIKFFAAGRQSLEDIDKHWNAARYELASLGKFAVPYLVSTMALESMGTTGKVQCAKSLALIGKEAVPTLLQNLERGDESFQRRIIEILGEIKNNQEATVPLVNLYKKLRGEALNDEEDSKYGLRLYTIISLGNIKDKEGVKTVEWALSDPNRDVRKAAIEASITFAAREYVYLLKKAEKVSRQDFPLSKYHTRIASLLQSYK